MQKNSLVDVMDEPFTRLHMSDIENIIFEGTPLELSKCKESLTAKYM